MSLLRGTKDRNNVHINIVKNVSTDTSTPKRLTPSCKRKHSCNVTSTPTKSLAVSENNDLIPIIRRAYTPNMKKSWKTICTICDEEDISKSHLLKECSLNEILSDKIDSVGRKTKKARRLFALGEIFDTKD